MLNEIMQRTKVPAAFTKDSQPGDTVRGKIIDVQSGQVSTPPRGGKPGEPQFWDDAKTRPKLQAIIDIQTDQKDPFIDNDDGVRRLYIETYGVRGAALAEAIEAFKPGCAPDDAVKIGHTFMATYIGMKPTVDGAGNPVPGANPTKHYKYEISVGLQFNDGVTIPPATPTVVQNTTDTPVQASTPEQVANAPAKPFNKEVFDTLTASGIDAGRAVALASAPFNLALYRQIAPTIGAEDAIKHASNPGAQEPPF